jgi:hypothetical protein
MVIVIILRIVILNVFMLNVIMLSVIMLDLNMLSVCSNYLNRLFLISKILINDKSLDKFSVIYRQEAFI